MENKKYELIMKDSITIGNNTLYRIKALRDFSDVKAGDLGGYIESENNLSHDGDCWVYGNAKVFNDTKVCGIAKISNNANISSSDDYIYIGNIGSRKDCTTFYKDIDNNIMVICGCFNGSIDEFERKVIETHKDNKYAKEYLAAIEFAQNKINTEDNKNE